MTAAEWTVGYGIPYAEPHLIVGCPQCGAHEGEACSSPRKLVKGHAHARRLDKARHQYQGKALRLMLKLERRPDAAKWHLQSIPHRCGTLGPHVMSTCTPIGGAA